MGGEQGQQPHAERWITDRTGREIDRQASQFGMGFKFAETEADRGQVKIRRQAQALGNRQELPGRQPFTLFIEHQAQGAFAVRQLTGKIDDREGNQRTHLFVEGAADHPRPLFGGAWLVVFLGRRFARTVTPFGFGSGERTVDARQQRAGSIPCP